MTFKEKFIQKLKNKYRLTVYNESTLHEVMTFYLTRINLFTWLGISVLIIAGLVTLLFIFTPLNAFLPAYSDSKLKRQIIENTLKIDSLQNELVVRQQYFQNIKNIMDGKEIVDYSESLDTTYKHEKIEFTKSKHDSLLRQFIEEEEQLNLSLQENNQKKYNISGYHFYMPVKGIITNEFNAANKHFGIDIAGAKDEAVLATLEGTVVLATWSLATGYVIQIQHENNLISIYKHNATLLKKEGDHVLAGESIAIIGNSGELSTGPHLHFELWHNGIPVDPQKYIAF